MQYRTVQAQNSARATADGDGVKLNRVFGGGNLEAFDPFLMMDEFGSDQADDYIGGFPPHPHRGFETITYMLQGKMEHQDHIGNRGLLTDGGVQWMTAGRGIIHSEMPKQTEGVMRGFQVWLNLPAAEKMQPAHYEDVSPEDIPQLMEKGFSVKGLAGETQLNGVPFKGYFTRPNTEPLIMDFRLDPGAELQIALSDSHRALFYVYEGEMILGAGSDVALAAKGILSRLSDAGDLIIKNESSDTEARGFLLAGKPLAEPIAHYGPFVMNSAAEIEQALSDYRAGRLTA